MASLNHLSIHHILIIFVFCSCFISNTYVASITLSIDTDKQALISIKSQTITQPPDALATWDPNSSPCNWTRVLCGDRGRRVVGLDLSGLQIIGQISPHIGNLSFLRSLELQDNQYEGNIPQTITKLFRLQVLNVSSNNIQGPIPSNISQCVDLRVMDLMQNKISGLIPEGITLLTNLQTLNLAKNNISGSIPPSIANLSSLSTLNLGTNTLSGLIPSDLARLRNLKNLDLTINNLTGTIPPSIYNMSSLETLAVASNDLWGDIPYNVGDTLPNLLVFNFCINRFTGTIPGSLHNLTNIRVIRMAHNQLHGTVPPGLGNLPKLEMYNIGYNNIVSNRGEGLSFLNSLVNSTKLGFLAIDGNQFDGVIPEFIGNLSKQLRSLYMGSNRISGSIPSSIGQLKGLGLLNISYNSISGRIPREIGQLENLQELILGKNRLSSYIPNSLGNLRNLSQIDLSNNELGGSIPISFRNFGKILSVDLSMNNLNGSIPVEVLDLPSLTTILNLSSNSLSGQLPREIGLLERVVTIDLSNNHLSGNIPNSIKNCKSLEKLFISRNYLSGNIPGSLGEIKGLETLDLSSNQLSGLIPLELQNLMALQSLNLSFNNLEGKVPSNGVFSNLTSVHLEGNPKLCYDSKFKRGDNHRGIVISVAVIAPILAIVLFIALFFYFRRNNVMITDSPDSFKGQHQMVKYEQLRSSTSNFSDECLIGRGSFGSVYKGYLNLEGHVQEIAVKVLDMETTNSLPSFLAECAALRHLRHRNLVKLITSCSTLDHKNMDFLALIYEFLKNGSLEKWIRNKMGFMDRLKVAIDVASGLSYLHHECVVAPVVHCDLKPSNVLLDDDLTAKIGDFGLASMIVDKDQSISSAHVLKGSMGYIPPEYGIGAKPSINGDVYSYGIMLMEIFTGKSPTDDMFIGGLNLKTWVQSVFPTNLDQVLDPGMLHDLEELCSEGQRQPMSLKIQLDCLTNVIGVALSCTNSFPEERITILEALRKLKSVQDMLHKSNPSMK
ncbi:serine-threonine/tyrosine-protein kinase catalytic domain-containing protein [Artemisia annua]|uniref:non-specific serine/threonine protein kinase n=1 Tax=Artemisia annua TaxID=35608 RepID=A0A2U1MTD4_ARTAN|nr:serine-threonine/tyrosine-protein kinase catalytic domain-containing protein [Artemisia annua]